MRKSVIHEKSLQYRFPEIARQWHPIKNGEMTPRDVTYGSEKEVWWIFPYDDPRTGKHYDFEWKSKVYQRTYRSSGCPFLTGKAVWPGFNDLESAKPELASQWHPTKNGDLRPTNVMQSSNKKVWWLLPYDDPLTGKHFDFEWMATINSRFRDDVGCPFLCGKAVMEGFNDLATLMPEIAIQWHPTRNGKLKPTEVPVSCMKKVWWLFPYDDPKTGKHFDFEWDESICERIRDKWACPVLVGKRVWPGFNDLASNYPDISSEWDYTRNRNIKPKEVTALSSRKAWWVCPLCGKSWKAVIRSRIKGHGHRCGLYKDGVNT